MKKLPKIYQNDFHKKINNNKTVCYLENKDNLETENKNIEETLSKIFNGMGYAFNIPVIIKTNDNTYTTSLVAKTRQNVITLDNDIIPIDNIREIEIIK